MLEHVKHQVEVFFSSSQKDVKISLCLEPQFVLFLLKLRWPKIRKMLPNSEIEALVRLRTLMTTIGSCTQKVMIDKSTVRGCSRRSNFVLIIPLMIIITGRGRNESELSQGSGARARGRGWGGGGYLGKCLLGMCRWPLRAPIPFLSIFWPIIDPILVTFWKM